MYRIVVRRLCKQPVDFAEQAKQSQRIWDMLVPERNIGLTHPLFFVLGASAFGLHLFNRSRDDAVEAELRQRRLEREAEKRKANGSEI